MSEDSEPARPPPPKSYVPITLMEGPTPTLPPRPVEQGNVLYTSNATASALQAFNKFIIK